MKGLAVGAGRQVLHPCLLERYVLIHKHYTYSDYMIII
jgi:hypothetical protein